MPPIIVARHLVILARFWRTLGISNPAPGRDERIGILRAADTRENDKMAKLRLLVA
ncbi:MAG: hypothetical protein JOZ29_20150 [Deltaproteobacteria bacterium]|nr:hypothetical protein [Deltaproteobacteria bacterium]